MNDYTHNMQFYHWEELFSQKELGNLDFFSSFLSKVAIAALLLKLEQLSRNLFLWKSFWIFLLIFSNIFLEKF